MEYAMCETENCGGYANGMTDFCVPCNRERLEPKLTSIVVTEQPNGNLVELVLDGVIMISAIINLKKWFMFRKVRLVSARGMNYEWAKEEVLKHYKSYHLEHISQ